MSSIKVKDADSTDKYYQTIGVGDVTSPFLGVVADFYLEVQKGMVYGHEMASKFGRNSDVDAGVPEDVWEGGGTYTGQPVSFTPETIDVVSTSANDTSAGTGARTVRITGLKSSTSTDYETEDLTLNGTTNVTSVGTWWRVNRIQILTAGSGDGNAGVITCNSTTTTANVFAAVSVGYNQTTVAAYTVPFGKTAYIKRIRTSITRANGSAGSGTISLRIRETGGVYQSKRVFDLGTDSPTEFNVVGAIVVSAGSDIKFRVDDVSDANTQAEAAFEMIIIDN